MIKATFVPLTGLFAMAVALMPDGAGARAGMYAPPMTPLLVKPKPVRHPPKVSRPPTRPVNATSKSCGLGNRMGDSPSSRSQAADGRQPATYGSRAGPWTRGSTQGTDLSA